MVEVQVAATPPVTVARRVERAWHHATLPSRLGVVGALIASLAIGSGSGDPVAGVALGLAGSVLVLAALVDTHEHRLPNRLLALALLGAVLAAAAGGVAAAVGAAAGLVLAAGPMLLVRLARGVGMGDVKMAGVVGACAGTRSVIGAMAAVAVAAAVAAAHGGIARRYTLPLGPALWCGWAVALAGARWW